MFKSYVILLFAGLISFSAHAGRDPRPILVVTGLADEASIASWHYSAPDVAVVISGGNARRLRGLLARTRPGQYRAIVSFGIAGGVAPGIRVGDLVVASEVVTASGGVLRTSKAMRAQAQRFLTWQRTPHYVGRIFGLDQLFGDPAAKEWMRRTYAPMVVDNESHVVAQFARRTGMPFLVLRVASEPPQDGLPPAALVPLNPNGTTNGGAVAASVLSQPWQIPQVLKLGLDTQVAYGTLYRIRDLLRVL